MQLGIVGQLTGQDSTVGQSERGGEEEGWRETET